MPPRRRHPHAHHGGRVPTPPPAAGSIRAAVEGDLPRQRGGTAVPARRPIDFNRTGRTVGKNALASSEARRHPIDPLAYLQDVYARLPTMTADALPLLPPDRWLQDHPQHVLSKRVQEAIERARRAAEERAARRRAA